jgi:hypothetical protein
MPDLGLSVLFFVFIILTALIPLMFSLSFFFGAPFVKTPVKITQEMLDLIELGKNDIFVDLGSGDGSVLIEAYRRGALAKGYEINPFLVVLSKLKFKIKRMDNNVITYAKPYQKGNFRNATVVFCYTLPRFIASLEKKLSKDLPQNSKIISYKFNFPNLKLLKETKSGIYIYSPQRLSYLKV